uniref:Biotin carboxyl carrier protein of acetyl-CoA carboxylase n=1 Tax=Sonderella linearis TaxID=110477 RepID=A0A1Z1MLV2_9FLOR|nr:acetyl-CoA carboxylase biotin carboxyl carrier protein [Sonderella linearis]ARW67063.1 acetyl-CoA carboxylase biotin carboxyl carrier protein [Sonderella linearis]
MILKLNNIKNFIHSIKKSNIRQLYFDNQNIKILINKSKKQNNIYDTKKYLYTNDNININNNSIEKEFLIKKTLNNQIFSQTIQRKQNKDKSDNSSTYSTIISPMVGTFYRSPAPTEPPFIEKNHIVKNKQTVCIIEAMKLMNEIESEINGEIVEILVKDGDIVDRGQILMKVKLI